MSRLSEGLAAEIWQTLPREDHPFPAVLLLMHFQGPQYVDLGRLESQLVAVAAYPQLLGWEHFLPWQPGLHV